MYTFLSFITFTFPCTDLCSEIPLMEVSISCDNLLCDALGRTPSCRVVVYFRNGARSVASQDIRDDCLNKRRKSLKDSSKDLDTFTEAPNTAEDTPKNLGCDFSSTRPSQTELHNQVVNLSCQVVKIKCKPLWQKHSMSEIVEVSCKLKHNDDY